MKRTMFQLYLEDCDEAIEVYTKAFDATVEAIYRDDTGKILHAEIIAFDQYIALSEIDKPSIAGNTMQFCFQLGEAGEASVIKAYDVLKEDAKIDYSLGAIEWSRKMFSLVDRFGVYWCVFV